MPRIPGPESIPTASPRALVGRTPQVVPRGLVREIPVDRSGTALAGLGGELARQGQILQTEFEREREEQQRRDDRAFLARSKVDFREALVREFYSRQQDAGDDVAGFTDNFDKFARDRMEQTVNAARESQQGFRPSEDALATFQAAADATRIEMFGRAASFEFNARSAKRVGEMNSSLNALQRVAQTDHTQLASVLQEADDLIAEHAADLNPQALAKLRTDVPQDISAAAISGMVLRGSFDAAEDLLPSLDLDADKELQLRDAIKVERDRVVAKARTELRQDVRNVLPILERGYAVAGQDVLLARARAVDPETAAVLAEAIEDGQAAQDIARLPAPQLNVAARKLRDELQALDQAGGDPRTYRRIFRLQEAVSNSAVQLQSNPYGHAVATGVIDELPPIDLSSSDAFESSLLKRRDAEALVEQYFQLEVPTLKKSEAKALEDTVSGTDLTPDAALDMLNILRRSGGPELAEAFTTPSLQVAVAMTATRPDVAREVVQGARLLANDKSLAPAPAVRDEQYDAIIGDALGLRPDLRQRIVETANAIYATRNVGAGETSVDVPSAYAAALRLAAGASETSSGELRGGPVQFNSHMVLPPAPGVDEDEFETLVRGLSNTDLVRYGNGEPMAPDGSRLTTDLFDSSVLDTGVYLRSVSDGRYAVFIEGLGVVSADAPADNNVYLLDLAEAWKRGVSVTTPTAEVAPGDTQLPMAP